jgi:hypothetical protein
MDDVSDAHRCQRILRHFQAVHAERAQRTAHAGLADATLAIKAFQERRFRLSYADLIQSDRYCAPSLFFLEELYGPSDFGPRDAQFERVIPALVRLFPESIVQAVEGMAELHGLSEQLDTEMGRQLLAVRPIPRIIEPLDIDDYRRAWAATGRMPDRHRQLALTLQLGRRLDRLTRQSFLRGALKLMRGPAKAAGLEVLQAMLERGFDTFHAMQGAQEFLQIIEERETEFIRGLGENAHEQTPASEPEPLKSQLTAP